MGKYILDAADNRVNISSYVKLKILGVYHELYGNGRIQTIGTIETIGDTLQTESMEQFESPLSQNEPQITKYITIFDAAMDEIMTLMRTDSLKRFYRTIEYRTMTKDDQHISKMNTMSSV